MSKISETTLWIKDARLGFPALLMPKSVQGGEAKYSCNFILDPTAIEWKEMGEIIRDMAVAKWGENAAGILGMIKAEKRLRCYGAGAEKISSKDGSVYDGFDGQVYISAANAEKPILYGQNAQPLPPTANANQMFAGGNYVSGIVSFWLQDNQFGRAVRANLDGVQFLRVGEHFGSTGPDTAGIFTAVEGAPAATADAPNVPAAGPLDFL
jgi:hypothetical protein